MSSFLYGLESPVSCPRHSTNHVFLKKNMKTQQAAPQISAALMWWSVTELSGQLNKSTDSAVTEGHLYWFKRNREGPEMKEKEKNLFQHHSSLIFFVSLAHQLQKTTSELDETHL